MIPTSSKSTEPVLQDREKIHAKKGSRKRRILLDDIQLSQPNHRSSPTPHHDQQQQQSLERDSVSPLTLPDGWTIDENGELVYDIPNTPSHQSPHQLNEPLAEEEEYEEEQEQEELEVEEEEEEEEEMVDTEEQEQDSPQWNWETHFHHHHNHQMGIFETAPVPKLYTAQLQHQNQRKRRQPQEQRESGLLEHQHGGGGGGESGTVRNVDIRDLYSYELSNEEIWKDAVNKKHYKLKFSKDLGQFSSENHELYAMALMDLGSRIGGAQSSTRMGIAITPKGGDTLYVHPRPVHHYTSNFLEKELEQVMQSARDYNAAGDQLDVTVTFLHGISGSGRRKGIFPIYKKLSEQPNLFQQSGGNVDANSQSTPTLLASTTPPVIKKMRGTFSNHVEHLCLGTAVARGMARVQLNEDPKNQDLIRKVDRWKKVSGDKPTVSPDCWQDARNVLQQAGITKDYDFTMEDVRQVQNTLKGSYQILVFNKENDPQPAFIGPYVSRSHVIPLLYDKAHFELIFSLPQFIGTHFYCTLCCTKGQSERLHYKCPLKCSKCLHDNCPRTGNDKLTCPDCGITFSLKSCFYRHKQEGLEGGRSRCSYTKTCKKCKQHYYTDRGIKHQCGFSYCQVCRTSCEKGHTHSLAVKPPLKKYSEKRIFFDLETMEVEEDGLKKHRVVLASALRCCASCRDEIPTSREAALQSSCDHCSPDGERFKEIHCFEDPSKDVMEEFTGWLLHRNHVDFVVLAHNLKGFDGQLLLQYILRPHIPKPKTLIMAGRKINFIDICGMRIIDSYNFVPFALAKFSKAFSVPEITKGEFPFRFIKEENFNYIGKMPAREFYGYSEKNESARAKFDKFYDDKIKSLHIFVFKKEIVNYCFSDVALLAAAMTKFEQGFLKKTNVVLFEEAVTAAGAAITTFQRNFVKPDTMALDTDPSSTRIKQSAIARRFIAYLQTLEQNSIQCVDNIGEYKIPGTPYHVDGYIGPCEKYPRGKAIEFYGDYFHAHSCLYGANQIIRGVDRAIDIWARDAQREAEIRQHCDLEVFWECEVLEEARTNEKLAQMLKQNLAHGPVVCREGLFGGRTEVIRLMDEADRNRKLYYLDFTSLYPFVMKNCQYPLGQGKAILGSKIACPISTVQELRTVCQGYMSCKVYPPSHLFIPVLPYRAHKLLFTLCKTCGEQGTTGECSHTDDERALYGTWTTVELELALSKGYVIAEVYGAIHWAEWTTDLFREYINTFLREKQEASGWPAWVQNDDDRRRYIEDYQLQEGIALDPANIKKDEVTRQVSKLLLNSLWGKFGQRVDVTATHIVTSASQFYRFMNNPTIEITHVEIINSQTIIVQTRSISGALQPLRTSCIQYSILTTAHARCTLYSALDQIPNAEANLAYMDTDSVIFAADRHLGNPLASLTGEYLGQLTSEIPEDAELECFVTIGAKSYAYKEIYADGREEFHVKAKGFAMNADAERKIDYSLMRKLVEEEISQVQPKTETIVHYHTIQRTANHTLVNTKLSKKFKFTFDKREILSDGGTLPFGFFRK